MGRGIGGALTKAWGGKDYQFTVTGTTQVTEKYIRVGFEGGGLLTAHPVHPTQWVRLWFPTDGNADKLQQRGYTLVDPDPDHDRFDVEFALHGGPASAWADATKPGDRIEATVLGSNFTLPDPLPAEFVVFGDTASLPAINSLLDAIGDVPARVWLEWQHETDPTLPVRATAGTEVTWLERVHDGQLLRLAADELTCRPDTFAWVACDGLTTRSITKTLRTKHGLPKTSIKSQAYWK
ncbi:siderophore-interacting protein [Skermania piniformis]|uniref:Siderophore-interacting protein n=1 Tax=Skermania pinensis TaxID=39122 RepID=A0ABX8S856_9ACTN|nr:siderophore-interacting protein [Skermania piniformis]QXQ13347.1 siderophore-interacting protein [Skermania piniformis]